MKTLELPRLELDYSQYIKREAAETDYTTLIRESAVIFDNGEPVIVYVELDDIGEDCNPLVKQLQAIDFSQSRGSRSNGMKGQRRTLGWMPRRPIRSDYCHISRLAQENPPAHDALVDYAQRASTWYQRYNPALHQTHDNLTKKRIDPEFQLPQSVFTSGIVNKNNVIPYHFDSGNFKGVWSCMLVFKHLVEGGYLAVPEYGVGFELKNNSLFMFDGQGIMHGVTPMTKKSRKAYRYSIVYYSLLLIWNCLPVTDEIARIRALKTKRELKRAGLTDET